MSDPALSLFEPITQMLFEKPHGNGVIPIYHRSQSHPDLKLWRQPWKLTEKSRMKTMALPDTKTVSASASLDAIQRKEPLTSSFQDYISSEHCYQKPQTLYQVLEPRLVLKTRVESVLEDRLHNTETVLKNDQQNNGEIQPALLKTSSCQLFNHSKVRVTSDVVNMTLLSPTNSVKYIYHGQIQRNSTSKKNVNRNMPFLSV